MHPDSTRPTRRPLLPRSVLRFAAPMLLSLTFVLIAAVLSVEMLSTIRAWVGGESLYSKGQKSAIYWLSQYASSHAPGDYRRYEAAIAFPLGDYQARLALQRHPADVKAAWQGFVKGGSDAKDIGSIITLFRLLGNVGRIRQAIDIWTLGDSYTLRLAALAARMHSNAGWTNVPPAQQEAIRAELNRINVELTPISARFSSTLGELARFAANLLIAGLALGTLITALLSILVTRARVIERDTKERGLARLSELYSALSQTSHLISRVTDRQQLFDEICRICVRTSGLALAAVWMSRPDRSGIELVAAHGDGQEQLEGLGPVPANSADAPAAMHAPLHTGRSRVFDFPATAGRTFVSQGSFPLRLQHQVIGVLCVFSREAAFFRDDIVDLLEQLANEASFALESLHREEDRRNQAGVLADQNRILNLIASGAELNTILHTLAQFAEAHSGGSPCVLLTQERDGSALSLGASACIPADFTNAVTAAAHEGSHLCSTDTSGSVPLLGSELDDHPVSDALRSCIKQAGLQSLRAWPVVGSKGQVLGALALFARLDEQTHPPPPHVIDICTNLAGIAIESCRASDRIRHLAHHDDLTGLPNRLQFRYQLPQALARAQRSGESVGVFFLDLDRFKVINDTLGHDAGDSVLQQIAKRLQGCARMNDSLARVGGDEFALLAEQFTDKSDLGTIAQRLLTAISFPVTVDGHEYRLTGSIGIAIYPRDGTDGLALLKNADIAMYRAKGLGRNNFQFYSSDINVHSLERLSLENQLRRGVAQGELVVHYQPKVDIRTERITGAEALVRWQHPERGLLLPGDFLFVADEVGLTAAIDSFVLATVCRDIMQWRRAGMPATRIAVNLSAQQFSDSRLIDDLNRILQDTGVDPRHLEFEITESVVMSSPERALKLLEHIKQYGITVAIDDFGTGHSSLAYLKRFPVDSVKIDYTFVRDLAVDQNDLAIIKAIIALAHSLDLEVIAEGVESVQQLQVLRRCRCDQFQGFLASKAIPSDQFQRLLLEEAGNPTGRVARSQKLALIP